MNTNQLSGTLTTSQGSTALRMQRKLAHPPQKVWAAITDPASLAQWFPAEVEAELVQGGAVRFRFPGDSGPGMSGIVTDVEEPWLFAFTWGDQHLSWGIAPYGEGTLLTLVHTFDDHFGAASFASGWHLCLTGLEQLLDGRPVGPGHDGGELHEEYVKQFDLDRGGVESVPGGKRVRFERQLVRPAETVWEVLSAGVEPVAGLPVPEGFTAGKIPAGPVTEVRSPNSLTYDVDPSGTVTWELRTGTGHGPRLVLTHTGPEDLDTAMALADWHARIEQLAARLLGG